MSVKPLFGAEDLQPSQKEQLAMKLASLASDPRFIHVVHLGGVLSQADIAENEQRTQAFEREWARLIAQHGQTDEYVKPLEEQAKWFLQQAEKMKKKISVLQEAQRAGI